MFSIKLTAVHFQLFLPPYKYYCYFTSFAVLYLVRIHNLMVFLVPSSSRRSPSVLLLPLRTSKSRLSRRRDLEQCFFFCHSFVLAMCKRSYAIPLLRVYVFSDSHPARNFVDFYFNFCFFLSFLISQRHKSSAEQSENCCRYKNCSIRESFPRELFRDDDGREMLLGKKKSQQ